MKTTEEITNSADILDSRDIISRIEWLEDLERDEDENAELEALKALAEEAQGSPDWTYGETLIRDSYFEDYAQELADDLGYTNKKVSWPYTCIDWERAARELQQDYFSVSFDGVDYWIRA